MIDTKKCLEAYDKVLTVMDSVCTGVEKYMKESVEDGSIKDADNDYQTIFGLALTYARVYALRDVMTLMVYGFPVDDALTIWKEKKGLTAIDLDGACLNAVSEAIEDVQGYEDDEEEE